MKSTKNTSSKPAKNTKTSGCSNSKNKTSDCCDGKRNSKSSSQEEEGDPQGSYTGNPIGWGKFADPVQDADDL